MMYKHHGIIIIVGTKFRGLHSITRLTNVRD